MGLEDRLGAAARQRDALLAALGEARARAARSDAAAEELRERVRKFAQAADKIKQGSAKRIERRDAIIAGLEAELATRDAKIKGLASAHDQSLTTIQCLQRRLLGKQALAMTPIADPSSGSAAVQAETEVVQAQGLEVLPGPDRFAQARRSALKSAGSARLQGAPCRVSFEDADALVAVLPIKSYRDSDLWVRKPGTWACCEQCEQRAVTSQGFLLSDHQRSQFMQEQFFCNACALKAGIVPRTAPALEASTEAPAPAEAPGAATAVAAAAVAAAAAAA